MHLVLLQNALGDGGDHDADNDGDGGKGGGGGRGGEGGCGDMLRWLLGWS